MLKANQTQPHPDSDLLCISSDRIDNAAFAALQSLTLQKLAWDMSVIAQAIDAIEGILKKQDIPVCLPWEDEDCNICYTLPDRCSHCTRHLEE